MQLIINIDDEQYNDIIEHYNTFPNEWKKWGLQAIKNGTPLKGYGKIIAEPTEEDIAKTVGGQNDFAECIKDAVKAVFDNVPTIIKADRSEEE